MRFEASWRPVPGDRHRPATNVTLPDPEQAYQKEKRLKR